MIWVANGKAGTQARFMPETVTAMLRWQVAKNRWPWPSLNELKGQLEEDEGEGMIKRVMLTNYGEMISGGQYALTFVAESGRSRISEIGTNDFEVAIKEIRKYMTGEGERK